LRNYLKENVTIDDLKALLEGNYFGEAVFYFYCQLQQVFNRLQLFYQ